MSTISSRLARLSAIAAAASIAACALTPTIPAVVDPRNVEVNGAPMSQEDFLSRYCRGQSDSNTCVSVAEALAASGSRSTSAAR